MRLRVAVCTEMTLNAVFHLGDKQFTLPIVVARPNERHANKTACVLEWYD